MCFCVELPNGSILLTREGNSAFHTGRKFLDQPSHWLTSQEDSDPLLSDRSHDTCRVTAWTCLQNVTSKCIHGNHKHCSWHFATVIAKEMCLRGKSYRVHDASPEKLYSGHHSLTSAYSTHRTDCSTDMKINVHYSQVAHRFRSLLVLTWPASSEMNTKPLFLTRCHLYKLASRNYTLTSTMSAELLSPLLLSHITFPPTLNHSTDVPVILPCFAPFTSRQFM